MMLFCSLSTQSSPESSSSESASARLLRRPLRARVGLEAAGLRLCGLSSSCSCSSSISSSSLSSASSLLASSKLSPAYSAACLRASRAFWRSYLAFSATSSVALFDFLRALPPLPDSCLLRCGRWSITVRLLGARLPHTSFRRFRTGEASHSRQPALGLAPRAPRVRIYAFRKS